MHSPIWLQRPTDDPVRPCCRIEGGDQVCVGIGGCQLVADVQQRRSGSRGQRPTTGLPSLNGVEGDLKQCGECLPAQPGGHPGELEHSPGDRPDRSVQVEQLIGALVLIVASLEASDGIAGCVVLHDGPRGLWAFLPWRGWQEKRARTRRGPPELPAPHPLLPSHLGNPLDWKVEPDGQPAKIPRVGDAAMLDLMDRLPRERALLVLQAGRALHLLSGLLE
jgi:hypothetical protein